MVFSWKFVLFFLQIYGFTSSQYTNVDIGAIFPKNSDQLVRAFNKAVQQHNTFSELFRLQPTVTDVTDINDSFQVQTAVCEMVNRNVAAIFGPGSDKSASVVAATCRKLQIPHFITTWHAIDDNFNGTESFTHNLFPHPKKFAEALAEIVKAFRWKTFAIVYDEDDSLAKFQDVFAMYSNQETEMQPIKLLKLPKDSDDFKPILKEIWKSSTYQVIIDCALDKTYAMLEQAISLRMASEYVTYFIARLDGYTINLSPLTEQRGNITTIRLMDPANADVFENSQPYYMRDRSNKPTNDDQQMTTEEALIQDAVAVFSKAFGDNATFVQMFQMNPASCNNPRRDDQDTTSSGKDVIAKINENTVLGLTDIIHFDENGLRDRFRIEVLELTPSTNGDRSYQKVAIYNTETQITLLKDFSNASDHNAVPLKNKRFKVLIHGEKPWQLEKKDLREEQNATLYVGGYAGFGLDLIEAISKRAGFEYDFEVTSEPFGKLDANKKFDGVIGRIANQEYDLLVGDVSVTYERKTAIDFTTPFYTLGITILYAKPKKNPAGIFSFLDPLSNEVWMHMATAFLCISITEFLLAKLSSNDWENPHPCDEDPEELENIWNMHNCIWLTVGSIMQQGCDILPKGVPARLGAAVWWFFALIVISSYTANLAAFLTKEQMEETFNDVEDLASQNQIQYGCYDGGSTYNFFKMSNYPTYQKIWNTMAKAEPSVFVKSNNEGVARVKNTKRPYAYFMESVPLKYITQTDCSLQQVGGLLDSKEYSIGLPPNSPYRQSISQAILKLQEDGTIASLIKLWWEDNNLSEETHKPVDCKAGEKEATETPELGMDNVGGVFLVLCGGLVVAILVGIGEFIWCIRRTSIDEKITPCEALKKELLFALSIWKTRKPCAPPSSDDDNEDGSDVSDDDKSDAIHLKSVDSIKQNGLNGY